MDNLQSITYQTFEQDPVKYEKYEEVGFFPLVHQSCVNCVRRRSLGLLWNGPIANACEWNISVSEDNDMADLYISVCCIAGAGRGPLVTRCLSAIDRSKREAFVYAVEKNPNAYVT
jgi:protein arginine N-methyltransferase 5